jgi:hypothetical protein
MTILRGRPLYLVHLPVSAACFVICLFGMWPYAFYVYVCPMYLTVGCLVVNCTIPIRQMTNLAIGEMVMH